MQEEAAKPKISTIAQKFSKTIDVVEAAVREATVGLRTIDEIKKLKQEVEKAQWVP
jgi:hypothetical protein